MQWKITPYEGKEPYIFISYCHNDQSVVFPLLEMMDRAGFRVWYDGGIQWGEKWPDSIEKHLSGCEVCMAFCSKDSAKSKECNIEIAYAIDCNRKLLSVYLEDVRLEPWLEMRKGIYQSAFMYEYPNCQEFFKTLSQVEILQPCRDRAVVRKDEMDMHKDHAVSKNKTIPVPEMPLADYGTENGISVCGGVFSVSCACSLGQSLRECFDRVASTEQQDEFGKDSPLIRHMKIVEASGFLKNAFSADKEAENKARKTTKCIHGKENI